MKALDESRGPLKHRPFSNVVAAQLTGMAAELVVRTCVETPRDNAMGLRRTIVNPSRFDKRKVCPVRMRRELVAEGW